MSSGQHRIGIVSRIEAGDWPPEAHLADLVARAVRAVAETVPLGDGGSELGVTFSDDRHVRKLNAQWRGKDEPTNVLSFPVVQPERDADLPPMLGDIILAHETVAAEAGMEAKPLDHHIAHLVVHGLLHLLGYDHEEDEEAEEMEGAERRALARLAIPDPYA